MRTTTAVLALLVSLALAPAALAGGWATVEMSSTPDQAAGGTWKVDLTVLQHGRTPLENVTPAVLVDGERFEAVPAGPPGVYRAEVPLPESGTFRYAIDDGFTQRHAYPPVELGAGPAPASAADDGFNWTALLLAALAGLVAAGAMFALQRRRTVPHAEA